MVGRKPSYDHFLVVWGSPGGSPPRMSICPPLAGSPPPPEFLLGNEANDNGRSMYLMRVGLSIGES